MQVQKKFNVYKPNKAGKGGAMQFDLNAEKESIFLEAANQSGEAFDWGNKVVVKLSLTDMAKLLVVLEGKSQTAKLFHDSTKFGDVGALKNTAVEITKGGYGFFLKASSQNADGSLKSVNIPLSDDEAIALSVLFRRAIERIQGW